MSSLFLVLPLSTGSAVAQVEAPPPPSHGLRLPDIYMRDAFILANPSNRTYYMVATLISNASEAATGTGRAGVMVYKSKDLKSWDGPYVVFTLPRGTWADPAKITWAPEMHRYHGRYYLFFTLHNPAKILGQPPATWRVTSARGTTIASADSPDGPFTLVKTDSPIPPADFMTLDGTLYVDPAGKPWMVYAHEWAQKIDGTMEAVPLKADLSAAAGRPIFLFKGSDAPWLDSYLKCDTKELSYVTDGPELYRTRDRHLLMLWASFGPHGYIETVARSKSGGISGPWEQLQPLYEHDGGHGMLFRTFDGKLMLVLHQPNHDPSHARLFEVSDEGDHLKIVRERLDLDGEQPPAP